jgi:hypothetical protein
MAHLRLFPPNRGTQRRHFPDHGFSGHAHARRACRANGALCPTGNGTETAECPRLAGPRFFEQGGGCQPRLVAARPIQTIAEADIRLRVVPAALRPWRSFRGSSPSPECRHSLKRGGSCSDACCGWIPDISPCPGTSLHGGLCDSQKVRVDQRAQCAQSTGIVARSAAVTATRLRPRPPATDMIPAEGQRPLARCTSLLKASNASPVRLVLSD